MAVSKLFTPQTRDNWHDQTKAELLPAEFVGVPQHAYEPMFNGPTDEGQPWHPLHLGGERGTKTPKVEHRDFVASPQESTDY